MDGDGKKEKKKGEFKVDPTRFVNRQRLSTFRKSHPLFQPKVRAPRFVPTVQATIPKTEVKQESAPTAQKKKKQKVEKPKPVDEQSFKPRRNIRLFNNTVERPSGIEKKKRVPPKLEIKDRHKDDDFMAQYKHPPLGVDRVRKIKKETTSSPVIGRIADNTMEDDQLYFVQFPMTLPVKKTVRKVKKKKKSIGQMEYQEDFWSTHFGNSFQNKQGRLGKLYVYKSGKTKLVIGETSFDVHKGSSVNFGEDVVKMDKNEQKCCFLGKVQRRLVCTPDLNELI